MANLLLMVVLGMGVSGCSHLFYYPDTQREFFQPEQFLLKKEEVWIDSSVGKLHAWWFPAQGAAKGTVLFFHGNAENLTSHFASLSWLPGRGYNYLIFDYPGYGKSVGKPTQHTTVESGRAALRWIWANKDKRPIVYGQSLGGNIAMRTVELERNSGQFRALIVDGTFPSYKGIAAKKLRLSYITWLLNPLAYVLVSNSGAPKDLKSISPIPVLVVHGDADAIVEPEFGDQIYQRLGDPKQFLRIPGGQHGQSFWTEGGKYRADFLKFLDAYP